MNQKKQESVVSPSNGSPTAKPLADVASESLQQEQAEQKDRYLRLAADFENFRKRTAQETERRAAAQKEALIHDLLPVMDNLERALTANAKTSLGDLRQGVDMTLQQLRQILVKSNIEAEESQGKPFDPLRHEAIGSQHDPLKPDHTVLETAQRGYRRGLVVFRPAKVIVNDHGQ